MRFLNNLVTRMLRPPVTPKLSGGAEQTKTSAAGPMIAWSSVGQPRWTPRRYDQLAEEGFRKNVVAYRCVMQIATACSAVPWLAYDKDSGSELCDHPILDLLNHPNPLQDGVTFLQSVYADLEIAGNAYIEAVRTHPNEAAVELYVLRPDRMKVIPGPAGLPQGYQYSVNGQTTTWGCDPITGESNILHLKRFHPLDDWYGMAPMEAALLSIDQHNAAGAWNQALLGQGARPSGALVYAPKDGPTTLSDDQIKRLREEMGMMYQGDRNAGRPMILEGGLDWKEMSLSPKDMDWLAGRNNAARDIAVAFGVPAQLIGIPDSMTHANFAEARLAFYEETVLPHLTRVTAGFDHWLCPMYDGNIELDFNIDVISALNDKRQAEWSRIQNATFLTRDEMREAAGYQPIEDGDKGQRAPFFTRPAWNAKDDVGDAESDNPDPASCDNLKYSADQPRVPAGNPDGGEWTSGGGGDGSLTDAITPVYPLETALGLFLGDTSGLSEGFGNAAEATTGSGIGDALGATTEDIGAVTKKLVDTLMPEGKLIGEAGSNPLIRELPGGSGAAEQMFQDLTEGGIPYTKPYNGIGFTMPDGSFIGYRSLSNSGLSTIDINVAPLKNIIKKIKFLD